MALVGKMPDYRPGGHTISSWSYNFLRIFFNSLIVHTSTSYPSWSTIELVSGFWNAIRPTMIDNGGVLLKGCRCEVTDSDR